MSPTAQRPSPPLAEIPEAEAVGSVAALYADIRATLGVNLVNLVFRHLATVPGALEWAWANLAGPLRSGAIDAQARALREAIGGEVAGWASAFPSSLGREPGASEAWALARAYNLNNSRNLIAFGHLLGVGHAGTAAESSKPEAGPSPNPGASEPADARPPAATDLPPLPDWTTMNSVDRATVLRLNRLGESGEPAIVASLYRHLSLWPSLLGELESALVWLDSRGEIARAMAHAVGCCETLVRAAPLPMPHPAPPAVDDALLSRLAGFARVTIPKMVPVGLAVEAALADTARRSARGSPPASSSPRSPSPDTAPKASPCT